MRFVHTSGASYRLNPINGSLTASDTRVEPTTPNAVAHDGREGVGGIGVGQEADSTFRIQIGHINDELLIIQYKSIFVRRRHSQERASRRKLFNRPGSHFRFHSIIVSRVRTAARHAQHHQAVTLRLTSQRRARKPPLIASSDIRTAGVQRKRFPPQLPR
ncbi:MAG: hypothetical protein ACXW32_13695 [Limisphaerales bacterium]